MAKPITKEKIRRILIIKWSAMGDVVGATTFIVDIRGAYHAAEIHLNTLPPWDRLFEGDQIGLTSDPQSWIGRKTSW